jgi:broad specificity phosphatase PhoE
MSTIYLARHGQASFGKEDYDVLSEKGAEQSRLLARYLIGAGVKFDRVFSGSIERQRRTAEIIAGEYSSNGINISEIVIMPEFNEYDSKSIITSLANELIREDPELKDSFRQILTDRKAFQKIFERAMLKWAACDENLEGIESWSSVKTRVSLAIAKIAAAQGSGKTLLVVASGGTISAAVQDVTDVSDETAQRLCWQIANTSISTLVYNDERITLRSFNAWPHLDSKRKDIVTFR